MTAHNTDVLTLEEVLRQYGPYFNGGSPTDEELFSRLDEAGKAWWRIGRPAEREVLKQVWADFFKTHTIPGVTEPWRVVQEAIKAGATATDSAPWRWYGVSELAELPPIQDLVSGHIPTKALVTMYGPSGHGKTFLALDLALSVATGTPWHGYAVEQGPVAYIIAEGVGGLSQRVQAWREEHQWTDPIPIKFLPQPVHLLEPVEAARLVTDLGTWDPVPKFVVVDTLAWCIAPGDENSTKDMSQYVAAIGELRAATGATVLTLHHTGHDTSRERGNTALKGAMDTHVKVKQEDETITMTCDKQREAVPFPALRFRLEPAGDSVVPVRAEDEAAALTKSQRECLETLIKISLADGTAVTAWKESVPEGMGDRTFWDARKRLVDGEYVRVQGKRYFPTEKGKQEITANALR